MTALPLINPDHISRGFLPCRVKRASPAVFLPRIGLAHQFQFQSPHQIGRQALADVAHLKSLSLIASLDGSKTIWKRLDDGSESFDEKGKAYD